MELVEPLTKLQLLEDINEEINVGLIRSGEDTKSHIHPGDHTPMQRNNNKVADHLVQSK